MKRRKQQGFSLIELLIVVTIILVITAIAIPAYSRAKRAGNEGAAAGTLRSLSGMVANYSSSWGNSYPSAGTFTAPPTEPDTCNEAGIPVDIGGGNSRNGYLFTYTPGAANANAPTGCGAAGSRQFVLIASPETPGVSGNRYFCISDLGTMHVSNAAIAGRDACEAADTLSSN